MPTPVIQSFAKKSGKSVADVEALWDKAKARVTEEYRLAEPGAGATAVERAKFYRLTVGILRRMLKLESAAPAARRPVIGAALARDLRDLGFADVAEQLE